MITVIVQFPIAKEIDVDRARALFVKSAEQFRDMPGLVRKYFLFGEGIAGGVYLWESRAAAERLYTQAFRDMIAEKYAGPPQITYFESPVIVDNLLGEVQVSQMA